LKNYGTTVDTRTMKYSRNMSKYFSQINRIWEKTLKEIAEEYTLLKKTLSKYFYQINGMWAKDSKRTSRIHII
jgi:hypothetical protein